MKKGGEQRSNKNNLKEMKYNLLLKQVKSIIDLYEKHAELSGEKFNVFSIMGMDSDEVRTHSAILGELLNPKGNHSLGSKPLELFVKQVFKENSNFELDYESSICQKELHIGKINEDKTEGGRVDLILKDTAGCKFVIENKIYAPEQTNQLKRYKTAYPEAKILYLTLEGDESKAQDDVDYQIILYKTDILSWIESCAKEAFDKPMVREVLNQYTYLLKKLTNQTTNTEMKDELKEVIKNNYTESLEIYKNFEEVRQDYVSEIFEKIQKQKIYSENIDWKIEFDNVKFNIWTSKASKALLFSDKEDSINFYYLRYEYSTNMLFLGIVPRKFTTSEKSSGKRSVIREEIKGFKESDLVTEYLKSEKAVIENDKNKNNSIIEVVKNKIKSYISKNQTYYQTK